MSLEVVLETTDEVVGEMTVEEMAELPLLLEMTDETTTERHPRRVEDDRARLSRRRRLDETDRDLARETAEGGRLAR